MSYTRKMLLRRNKISEDTEIRAELIWYRYQREGPIKGQPIEGGYYLSVIPVVTKVFRTLTYTTYKADSGVKILYFPAKEYYDKVMERLHGKLMPSAIVDNWMRFVEENYLEELKTINDE